MGLDDRGYSRGSSGGQGRLRSFFRRVFGDGENPLDWALPLYTAWGIRVRIHIIFVIMIAADLIRAIPSDRIGWLFMAVGLSSLFLLVLLHEYGHCLACRWVGGEADQILMWPLGGLASCRPPETWKANLITTLGGPAVNAALFPILGAAVFVIGPGWSWVVFNPFSPSDVLGDPAMTLWKMPLWWFHYINLLLLAFNMLLPMYPLDAGRVLQELLWSRMGYRRATEITVTIGLVVAVTLFVVAITARNGGGRLVAIALFGGITCWMERQRLRFAASGGEFEFAASLQPDKPAREPSRRQAERERQHLEEIDRILAKIAREGMGSLTPREKRALQKDTARRRQG